MASVLSNQLTHNATFSVIVPVYNAAKTVEPCVDSLVRSGGADLQVVLIEDCSKDNSWGVCQRLAEKYPTVIALHNECNRGVSYTRNRGLETATGEYLLFCDSDDYWEERYVDTFRAVVKAGHDFAICGYVNHDEVASGRTDVIGFEKAETISLRSNLKSIQDKTLLQQLWNKLFRADIVREKGVRFDESISIGEDLRFILDYIRLGDVQSVTLIDQPLYHYMRDQAGSLMYRVGYESIEEPLKNMAALYRLMGMAEDEIRSHIDTQRRRQIASYAYLIMHNMGMSRRERKRLIVALDANRGKEIYRSIRKFYYKEKLAKVLKR